jgi:hypothetical protein
MQLRKIGMCEVMKVKAMEDGFNTRMTNQLWRRNGIVSQHEIWQNVEVIVYQHGRCVTTNIKMHKKFLCSSKMLLCINKIFLCKTTKCCCASTNVMMFLMSNSSCKACILWRLLWFRKITAAWDALGCEPEKLSTNSCIKIVRILKNISCKNKCQCSKLKNNTWLYRLLLCSWFIIHYCVKNRKTGISTNTSNSKK